MKIQKYHHESLWIDLKMFMKAQNLESNEHNEDIVAGLAFTCTRCSLLIILLKVDFTS